MERAVFVYRHCRWFLIVLHFEILESIKLAGLAMAGFSATRELLNPVAATKQGQEEHFFTIAQAKVQGDPTVLDQTATKEPL